MLTGSWRSRWEKEDKDDRDDNDRNSGSGQMDRKMKRAEAKHCVGKRLVLQEHKEVTYNRQTACDG